MKADLYSRRPMTLIASENVTGDPGRTRHSPNYHKRAIRTKTTVSLCEAILTLKVCLKLCAKATKCPADRHPQRTVPGKPFVTSRKTKLAWTHYR